MAAESWSPDSGLTPDDGAAAAEQAQVCEFRAVPPEVAFAEAGEDLRENPCSFQFFQAVRLLELLGAGREPVGRFAQPGREAVRFAAHNSFPFPASQIQKIDWPKPQEDSSDAPSRRKPDPAPKMTVNFMGLTGPVGALPLVYTELVVQRIRERDHTMAEFFDIFNHRMISFFYQAWEKYRFPVNYQRSRDDTFSRQLNCLLGLGTPQLENRQLIDDDSLRFYTGLLSLQPRSAAALRDILIDYFGVLVEIEQFVGSWYPLKSEDQCCFDEGFALSEQLGVGAVVGDAVWDQQSRIRIRLGPMTMFEYQAFLPNGSEYKQLMALIRFFLNDLTDFEVQLVLKREDVPPVQLGAEDGEGPPLGWTTWMKSAPGFDRDPGDTVLRFEEASK
jgi:type VI secretion system protein ImpH